MKIKKIVGMTLSLFVMLSVFVGCADMGGATSEYANQRPLRLQVTDSLGNFFEMNEGSVKELEYEYDAGELTFSAVAYYSTGERFMGVAVTRFDMDTIHLYEPGHYELMQHYDLTDGPDAFFELKVTVKEEPDDRLVPIIQILPDEDCISYEMNKRYVYKYDGTVKMPTVLKAYDPITEEQIGSYDVGYSICNITVLEGEGEDDLLKEIGVYQFDILLRNNTIGNEGAIYAVGEIRGVILEIVP